MKGYEIANTFELNLIGQLYHSTLKQGLSSKKFILTVTCDKFSSVAFYFEKKLKNLPQI